MSLLICAQIKSEQRNIFMYCGRYWRQEMGLSESIFLEAAGIKNLLVNDYPIT